MENRADQMYHRYHDNKDHPSMHIQQNILLENNIIDHIIIYIESMEFTSPLRESEDNSEEDRTCFGSSIDTSVSEEKKILISHHFFLLF